MLSSDKSHNVIIIIIINWFVHPHSKTKMVRSVPNLSIYKFYVTTFDLLLHP